MWQMYKGSDGQPGSEFIDFLYNADGLRIAKQRVYYDANGEAYLENTSYTLHGKNIVHLEHEGNNLHFWYDASGKPAVVEFNGVKYGYLQNLQGDIVGIIDSLGNEVVKYTYDAWGKPLSCTGTMAASLGKLNPFRYRGYVFDEETGLYYLRNRYYDVNWSRFLNADKLLGTQGKLLSTSIFAYCRNCCINFRDHLGYEEESALITQCDIDDKEILLALGISFDNLLPNQSYYYLNGKGSKMYIWTGDDGKPIHSRHYTDHGKPKSHPYVPHDHDWNDKDDGSGDREQSHVVLKPEEDYSTEGAIELPPKQYKEVELNKKDLFNPFGTAEERIAILLYLLYFLYSSGMAPVPVM